MAADGDAIRVAKALRHPLRAAIFNEYFRQAGSPSLVARQLGRPVNLVAYHTRVLERLGCIRPAGRRREDGSRTRMFEARIKPIIEDEAWQRVPLKLRRGFVRSVLSLMVDDASRSAYHGGFDRPTVHVSRTPLYLDDRAADELATVLRTLLDDVAAIERASAERDDARARRELIVLTFDDVSPRAPA